jgi:hypothetical protein
VGRPERGDRRPLADFLLTDFDPATDVGAVVSRAADAAESVVTDGLDRAQATFN